MVMERLIRLVIQGCRTVIVLELIAGLNIIGLRPSMTIAAQALRASTAMVTCT